MYYKSSSEENSEEIIRRGKESFEALRKKVRLEPRYNGYYIVIDVESGEYFLDNAEQGALLKAREKLGEKNLFIHKCEFF